MRFIGLTSVWYMWDLNRMASFLSLFPLINVSLRSVKIFSVPLFQPSMQMSIDLSKDMCFSHASINKASNEAREVDRYRVLSPFRPCEGEALSVDKSCNKVCRLHFRMLDHVKWTGWVTVLYNPTAYLFV